MRAPDLGAAQLLDYTLAEATVRRIDETHANSLAAWIAMGAPDYNHEGSIVMQTKNNKSQPACLCVN